MSDALLAVVHVWRAPGNARVHLVTAKGAPEAIAALCGLDDGQGARVLQQVERMAGDGLRVLGVALGEWGADALPESPQVFRLQYLGLIGLADPVRPGVPTAIKERQSARTSQLRSTPFGSSIGIVRIRLLNGAAVNWFRLKLTTSIPLTDESPSGSIKTPDGGPLLK